MPNIEKEKIKLLLAVEIRFAGKDETPKQVKEMETEGIQTPPTRRHGLD